MKRTTWIVLVLFVLNLVCFSFPLNSEASYRQLMSGEAMKDLIGGAGQVETEILFPHGADNYNDYETVGTPGNPVKYIADVNNVSSFDATYTLTVKDFNGDVVHQQTGGPISALSSTLITGDLPINAGGGAYYYLTIEVQGHDADMIASDTVMFHTR